MTRTEDAYPARRVSEAELAAALAAVRYPPQKLTGGMGGASGHYRTDYEAHARLVMAAVPAVRRERRALRVRGPR